MVVQESRPTKTKTKKEMRKFFIFYMVSLFAVIACDNADYSPTKLGVDNQTISETNADTTQPELTVEDKVAELKLVDKILDDFENNPDKWEDGNTTLFNSSKGVDIYVADGIENARISRPLSIYFTPEQKERFIQLYNTKGLRILENKF